MATRIIRINLNKSDAAICLVLVAYNFFTKYTDINTRDLSWDEPFSAFYSQYSVPQIITELFKGNNPPFYEIFLHFYTAIFGISEFALRMPSLLFSCGTVAFLYYTGARIRGKWVGIFVGLLFAMNNLQYFYSLAARMYALFSMLVAASIYFSIVAFQEPQRKKYFYALLITNTLMCYTHYFAGFVIVAEVLAWLVTVKNKLFFKNLFFVFVANAILAIPLLIVFKMRAEGFVSAFEFKPPYPEIWKNIIMNLINGLDVYQAGYTFLALGAFIYAFKCIVQFKFEFKNQYIYILLFLLFALPLFFTWYYGNTYPLFIDRYYLYATIPLFLFSAICLSVFYRPLGFIWVPFFFLYLLNIYHNNFNRLNNDYLLREWQAAALTAKQLQHESPQSIILIDPLWADLGFSYYYDRELFKEGNRYNEVLGQKNVFRIWSPDSLNHILNLNPGKQVILYCDEKAKADSLNDGNYRLLQRKGYVPDTAYYFPVCTSVIRFLPNDTMVSK